MRALAVALAVVLATGCTVNSRPAEVYLLTNYGVTVGVFLSHQGADEKEASFSPEEQKHMIVREMDIEP